MVMLSPVRGFRPRRAGRDFVRLKAPAVPAHHRLVLLVERVPARFEKLHEAGDAPDILGRAPSLASDEYRVVDVALPVPHLFDEEVVAPVVAEVVDVEKLLDAAVDDRLQPDARRLVEPFIRTTVVLGLAIAPVPDLELEQVRVRPVERELDEVVERGHGPWRQGPRQPLCPGFFHPGNPFHGEVRPVGGVAACFHPALLASDVARVVWS